MPPSASNLPPAGLPIEEIAALFIFFAVSALYRQGTSGKIARKEQLFA